MQTIYKKRMIFWLYFSLRGSNCFPCSKEWGYQHTQVIWMLNERNSCQLVSLSTRKAPVWEGQEGDAETRKLSDLTLHSWAGFSILQTRNLRTKEVDFPSGGISEVTERGLHLWFVESFFFCFGFFFSSSHYKRMEESWTTFLRFYIKEAQSRITHCYWVIQGKWRRSLTKKGAHCLSWEWL